MTDKKDTPKADGQPQATTEQKQDTGAPPAGSVAEARRTKGYVGSAPGEDVGSTIPAVTKEDSK